MQYAKRKKGGLGNLGENASYFDTYALDRKMDTRFVLSVPKNPQKRF